MEITLKKCKADDCDFEFPAHYFADYCPDHANKQDDANAQRRCEQLFQTHGEAGVLMNAMSSFLPKDEASQLRNRLLGDTQ